MRVAIIARNGVLRDGLSAQIRAAGAVVTGLTEDAIRQSDIMLIDAGTDSEPVPPTGPLPQIPLLSY